MEVDLAFNELLTVTTLLNYALIITTSYKKDKPEIAQDLMLEAAALAEYIFIGSDFDVLSDNAKKPILGSLRDIHDRLLFDPKKEHGYCIAKSKVKYIIDKLSGIKSESTFGRLQRSRKNDITKKRGRTLSRPILNKKHYLSLDREENVQFTSLYIPLSILVNCMDRMEWLHNNEDKQIELIDEDYASPAIAGVVATHCFENVKKRSSKATNIAIEILENLLSRVDKFEKSLSKKKFRGLLQTLVIFRGCINGQLKKMNK